MDTRALSIDSDSSLSSLSQMEIEILSFNYIYLLSFDAIERGREYIGTIKREPEDNILAFQHIISWPRYQLWLSRNSEAGENSARNNPFTRNPLFGKGVHTTSSICEMLRSRWFHCCTISTSLRVCVPDSRSYKREDSCWTYFYCGS